MVFCPDCGKEVDQGAKFCLYCGADISDIASLVNNENFQQKSTTESLRYDKPAHIHDHHHKHIDHHHKHIDHHHKRNGSRRPIRVLGFFLIFFLTIGTVGYGIFTAATWGEIRGHLDYSYTGSDTNDVVQLNVELGTQDLIWQYNSSEMSEFIDIDLDYNVRGQLLREKTLEDVYTLSWDPEALIKEFKVRRDLYTWMLSENSVTTVTLRTDLVYNLTCNLGTGDIFLTLSSGSELVSLDFGTITGDINLIAGQSTSISSGIKMWSETGTIDVDLGNDFSIDDNLELKSDTGDVIVSGLNGIIAGKLDLNTKTGEIDANFANTEFSSNYYASSKTGDISLDLTNPRYTSNSEWWINTSTGDININLIQTTEMDSDVHAYLETDTGDFEMYVTINSALIGAKMSVIDIGIGDVDWNTTGFTSNNPYTSSGYSTAANLYDFDFNSDLGDIEGSLVAE